ncbi:unnamed protein product, partial [Leptidea sinapis]
MLSPPNWPMRSSSMQKVFETVQCASRWSGGSLSGSEPECAPKPKPKTISTDSFFEDISDVESEDLYPGNTGVDDLGTDRSISEDSAVWGAGAGARYRSPHKLQIVKPMEGSLTLHTWAQLARPTMSGLLEEQEGVGVRGSRSAQALGLRMYRLSDVEEDDDMLGLPHSSHIYTFTN